MKFQQKNSRAAKLTASEVIKIRELYANSSATQGQLSRDFGVSAVQIGRIIRGEVWQQLPTTMPTKEDFEISARRLMEVQNERPIDRLVTAIATEQAKQPDAMLVELSEPNAGDIAYHELTGKWPEGVKPKGSPD